MKIRATTNQLGLAPMRIPKTRASWIDPVPIHTHGGRRAQAGAPTADSRVMRLPSPRRMPRLGNVRLSVKLGLCFGAILALTAAIIAVDVCNVAALESAHERVTTRRGAADHRRPAGRGRVRRHCTSPRRRWCSPTAQQREDEMDDLRRRREGRRRAAQQRPTTRARLARLAAVVERDRGLEDLDAKLYAAVKRGDTRRRRAEPSPSHADAAADGVTTAIERYIARANTRPRGGRRALRQRSRARPRARRMIIGALALLAALGLALGARPPPQPPPGRRSRAPPRRSPRATSITSSPSRAATRSGAPPPRWPRWSSTCARWPAPPTASPPAT